MKKLMYAEYFLFIVSGILLASFLLFFYTRRLFVTGKIRMIITTFLDGLLSIMKLDKPWSFIACSIGIWICYFLMTWLWTFTFPESSGIGVQTAFIVMVIGTLGRSVPIQGGGFGAYHYLVSQALVLYGLTPVMSFALAVLIHGGQAVFTLLIGLISYVWLLMNERDPEAER
jgi:glycosyltransferase 2 family protein